MPASLLSQAAPVAKRVTSAKPTTTDGIVTALPVGTFVLAVMANVLPDATVNPVTYTDSKGGNTWANRDQPCNAGQVSFGWSRLATALAVADTATGTLTTARSNRLIGLLAFAGVEGLDSAVIGASGTSGQNPALTIPRASNGCIVVVEIECNATSGPVIWQDGWTHPAGYAVSSDSGTSDRRIEVGWRAFEALGSDNFAATLTAPGPWAIQAAVLRPTLATNTYLPTSDQGSLGVTRVPAGAGSNYSLLDDPTDDDADYLEIPSGGWARVGYVAGLPADHTGTAVTARCRQKVPGAGAQAVVRVYRGDNATPVASSAPFTPPDAFGNVTFVLTPAESAALGSTTSDWADVQARVEGV